ncbi:glycosyltransferase family 25 protein [Aquibium carbonis]|uniref:glycosyltransferase family 25 protein n=1 Tax=Aquibium carbonis TaxID=2495581 RepID=UPI0014784A26|nr:glycosyltransferase family 25 protein [Aquibium carbonis]
MRIFCINLDHRTDRRHYMEAQFAALGMTVERIRATTPADISAADVSPMSVETVREKLMPTEIATSISHHRAWRRMLEEGAPFALILEDDCELSPRLPAFLAALDRRSPLAAVIRIETRRMPQLLERRALDQVGDIALHRPFAWEWGTAGYVITADEARRILASPRRFEMPIDNTLLSPASPLYRPDGILQAVPALVLVEDEEAGGGSQPASVRRSDAQAERDARFRNTGRKPPLHRIGREIRRIRRQVAGIGTHLRHRMLGRKMAVPFADEATVSARSSSARPPA